MPLHAPSANEECSLQMNGHVPFWVSVLVTDGSPGNTSRW